MRILLVGINRGVIKELNLKLKNIFIVDTAASASKAISLSESTCYDSIIISTSLLDINGLELCKMLRSYGVDSPIALISNNDNSPNKVMCFDMGADAVISTTQFSMDEIIAQINVLVRRNGNHNNCENFLKYGDIKLDMKNKKFYANDIFVPLRRKEFDLLEYLMIHRDKPVSKEELLEHVWEKGIDVLSNTVEVHVRSIRVKFHKIANSKVIKTYRGFGYKIET